MQTHTLESQPYVARRLTLPQIRWGAVFAGTVVGFATYLLLSLFGLAVGLTAIDPQAAEPVGAAPMIAGIWTGISLLIAAFLGGYVAARMSGLGRRSDGVLHGFVAWAALTVVLAWLMTTAIGNLLGGTFSVIGQGIQATAQAGGAAAQAGGQQGGITQQLEQLITGSAQGEINREDLAAVQDRLQQGDRQGAVDIMVNRMGFTEERANQVVDRMAPIVGGQGLQQTAQQAVGAVTAAFWVLFFGLVLSLALSIWGGAMGSRSVSGRTLEDHTDERRAVHF